MTEWGELAELVARNPLMVHLDRREGERHTLCKRKDERHAIRGVPDGEGEAP